MFINLKHQKLRVYVASRKLVAECYRFTLTLPSEEKFAMASQIRRAAVSVHLNLAEGASRFSKLERKRFYEIGRGSIIEIDAAFDIAEDLGYFKTYPKQGLDQAMNDSFSLVSGLIKSHAD